MHTIHSFKILLAAGVLAIASVGFTACDSSTNQSASENHQGHEGSSAKEAVAVEVPDYAQAGAPLKAPLTEMYNHYLHLKDALVAAKADEAKAAGGALLGALNKTDASALSGEQKTFFEQHAGMIRQHARAIAGGSDLASPAGPTRHAFDRVPIPCSKPSAPTTRTLYYQHCPMANNDKGGNWISQTSEIKNPYFGDKMLKCGETKETLASK
jgi:Cu(I)/Ag(I) efflux system membrane fusion protein